MVGEVVGPLLAEPGDHAIAAASARTVAAQPASLQRDGVDMDQLAGLAACPGH